MSDTVEVTQADRDAALKHLQSLHDEWCDRIGETYYRGEQIALGRADEDALVQSFADYRHRFSNTPNEATPAVEDGVGEIVARLCDFHRRILSEVKGAWRKHQPRLDVTMSDAWILLEAAIEIERLKAVAHPTTGRDDALARELEAQANLVDMDGADGNDGQQFGVFQKIGTAELEHKVSWKGQAR